MVHWKDNFSKKTRKEVDDALNLSMIKVSAILISYNKKIDELKSINPNAANHLQSISAIISDMSRSCSKISRGASINEIKKHTVVLDNLVKGLEDPTTHNAKNFLESVEDLKTSSSFNKDKKLFMARAYACTAIILQGAAIAVAGTVVGLPLGIVLGALGGLFFAKSLSAYTHEKKMVDSNLTELQLNAKAVSDIHSTLAQEAAKISGAIPLALDLTKQQCIDKTTTFKTQIHEIASSLSTTPNSERSAVEETIKSSNLGN